VADTGSRTLSHYRRRRAGVVNRNLAVGPEVPGISVFDRRLQPYYDRPISL